MSSKPGSRSQTRGAGCIAAPAPGCPVPPRQGSAGGGSGWTRCYRGCAVCGGVLAAWAEAGHGRQCERMGLSPPREADW